MCDYYKKEITSGTFINLSTFLHDEFGKNLIYYYTNADRAKCEKY